MQVKHMAVSAVVVVSLAAMIGCADRKQPAPAKMSDAEYAAAFEGWRAERDAGLRRADSWLTLVGLFWLEEGENTFGSSSDNDLVFPEAKIAGRAGTFLLRDGVVSATAFEGVAVEHEGHRVEAMELAPDTSGDPTVITAGSLSFYLIERSGRLGIRLKDSEAPELQEFSGLDYFPLDRKWAVQARFERFSEPRTVKIPNVLGGTFDEEVHGVIEFEVDGETYELTPTGDPSESLFVVFGDETNGHETYGGGRFLTVDPPSADGTMVVDFNRAYNPPCVFSPYATCPLPPRQNKLSLRIDAGELTYGDH